MPPFGTTPILFPSGEDANPLNRRLPAEVVTRRQRPVKKAEPDKPVEDVQVELKAAVALKPEARAKWLARACKMAEENRASTTELYGIISSRKFASGLGGKVGRKMKDIIADYMTLFSDKQQRHLESKEWVLNVICGVRAGDGDAAVGDGEDAAEPAAAVDKDPGSSAAGDSKAKDTEERRSFTEGSPRDRRTPAPAQPAAATEEVGGWRSREDHDRGKREAIELEKDRSRRKEAERRERDRLFAFEEAAELEHQRAKAKKLEAQVDSSLDLLEKLQGGGGLKQKQPPPRSDPARAKAKDSRRSRSRSISAGNYGRGGGGAAGGGRGRDKRGASRSLSVKSATRSPSRRRGGRGRSRSPKPMTKKDFNEALRRRLAEREATDTTRIPVVDPGHAQRDWK